MIKRALAIKKDGIVCTAWTEPTQAEPQQQGPNPDMVKLQGEMAAKEYELELQQQSKAAELQLKEQEIATKAELEKYRIDTEAQTKVLLAQMQGEQSKDLESHKSAVAVDRKEKLRIENLDKLDQVVENTQAVAINSAEQAQMLAGALTEVVATLSQAVENLTAPKIPVRDKSGRIVRVETA